MIAADIDDLSAVTGRTVTPEQYAAIDRAARLMIGGEYRGDPDVATGRTAAALSTVWLSIASRLVANPGGARTVGLGSANVTFGGTDEDVANPLTLTPTERAALQSLRPAAPSWVALSPTVADRWEPTPVVWTSL